jgi:plasmid stabilization system protein ParE
MTLQIRISGRAERDVDTIFNWLAQRSRDGAVKWYHSYLASGRPTMLLNSRPKSAVKATQALGAR